MAWHTEPSKRFASAAVRAPPIERHAGFRAGDAAGADSTVPVAGIRCSLITGGTMDWLDAMQWPAMAVTVAAAWLVASSQERRRNLGFWIFLASNVLWITWGVHASAWALVVLQLALAAMNIRGAVKTEKHG